MLLGDLRAAQVPWPRSPAALRPAKPRPKRPRPHQRQAITAVLRGFEKAHRGQMIMACGTGKTLTALFIAERLAAKRTLVLVPSLSLLADTLREWAANSVKGFAFLPVCSDDTVSDTDALVSTTSDLGFPVTTDPAEIATFLRRRSGSQVVFASYHSSPRIAEAFRRGRLPRFDLVIADEAHRCAGRVSSDFATVLDSVAIPARRRLFMTATPRFFTGRVVKESMEADFEVASMDDESRFGPMFHRLGFSQAIKRGLLTDYQVVVVGVDDATYLDWAQRGRFVTIEGTLVTDARTLAGQIGLAKAMRHYDLRRIISFHSRVSRAREFAQSVPQIVAWMPPRQRPKGRLWSHYASGEMSAGARSILLDYLRYLDDQERGLLTNARCLGEGVDVPALDGVAFIDPRRSEVDIVQAVGRAIRLAENKKVGTIVIPVFIEAGDDPDAALDGSAFKPVWDVVRALRAHDDELGEQLDELRRSLGRGVQSIPIPKKVHLDLPAWIGSKFVEAFDVQLVGRTTESFEFGFGRLQVFASDHGHTLVPQKYICDDGLRLGAWVGSRRQEKRKGTLASERIALLESLPGWTWEPSDDRFPESLRHLQEYSAEYGHCDIPVSFICRDGFSLGMWASNRRVDFKRGRLGAEEVSRIEAVPGWQWSRADAFGRRLNQLQTFATEHGHARVPDAYACNDGFRLGAWVVNKRMKFKQGSLPTEQIEELERLPGWSWEALGDIFPNGLRHLQDFSDKQGHAQVLLRYVSPDGFRLGNWVSHQRVFFKQDTLAADRIALLEAVPGWTWNPAADTFAKGLRSTQAFIAEHGHSRVPEGYVSPDGFELRAWIDSQRQNKQRGRFTPDQIAAFDALPEWVWNLNADAFANGLRHLQEFVAEHGHCRPAALYVCEDGFKLGGWVRSRRNGHTKVSNEQAADLEAVPGWTWA